SARPPPTPAAPPGRGGRARPGPGAVPRVIAAVLSRASAPVRDTPPTRPGHFDVTPGGRGPTRRDLPPLRAIWVTFRRASSTAGEDCQTLHPHSTVHGPRPFVRGARRRPPRGTSIHSPSTSHCG